MQSLLYGKRLHIKIKYLFLGRGKQWNAGDIPTLYASGFLLIVVRSGSFFSAVFNFLFNTILGIIEFPDSFA